MTLGRALRRAGRGSAGFNLLEVMVAMAILAFLMAAITSTQGSSLIHGAKVYKLTRATQLLDSVILDLEEEFRVDGFPDNTVNGRRCDLPRGFDNFECEYDLIAMELDSTNVEGMGADATANIQDSPLMSAVCSGGPQGGMMQMDVGRLVADLGGEEKITASDRTALSVMYNPQLAELCGIRVQALCQNIPMITSFIPMIVEQAAQATRKLVIRLTWKELGRAEKGLTVETFITAVPEAEDQGP